MKKLKCWKKISNTEWRNKGETEVVFVSQTGTNRYNPFIAKKTDRRGKEIKRGSLTKNKSIKFANKYMKEHDTC